MAVIIHRYELTDEQWHKIESLLPTHTRGRPAQHDNRKMLNAILWINRTGVPWRDLPERYGPWKTVYTRFTRWARDGVLECVFRVLDEYVHIDSTAVSAHQHSACAKCNGPESEEIHIGRSRGGNTTKIRALVDALGNPITFVLTEGNRHDSPVALDLLKEVTLAKVNVVGDETYGSTVIRDYITSQGGTYTIPPKESAIKP